MKKYLLVPTVAVLVLLLFAGCTSSNNKVYPTDLSVSNFKYDGINIDGTGMLQAAISFTIQTNRDDLYFRAYDLKRNSELTIIAQKLSVGSNSFKPTNLITLSDLVQNSEIRLCYSAEQQFTKDSKNLICKNENFEPPKAAIEISPDPLNFMIDQKTDTRQLRVKNTGTFPLRYNIKLPEISEVYPVYGFGGNPSLPNELQPGESYAHDITAITSKVQGKYEATGYVWALSRTGKFEDALLKQPFSLKTAVIDQ